MKAWFDVLAGNPLLTLFLVTGTGYVLGRIRIGSFSLGVSAILFAGLAFGAIHPELALPGVVYQFGLVVFVYALGLASGPTLLSSFRRRGLRDTLLGLGSLAAAGTMTFAIGKLFNLSGSILSGVFSGSLTSTPALAGALEFLSRRAADRPDLASLLSEPVLGYSLTYPIGVLGIMITMHLLAKLWRVDFAEESKRLGYGDKTRITTVDVEVTVEGVVNQSIRALLPRDVRNVTFSRVWRDGRQMTVEGSTRLQRGDIVTVVGPKEEIDKIIPRIGRKSTLQRQIDRTEIDIRHVFVSNPQVVGRPLSELNLPARFGTVVSRIRRGNVELLARGSSVLELGDQIRIVGPTDKLDAVTEYFGDSIKRLGEVDVLAVSLGICLGLLIGMIPLPLFGGITFSLGYAAGPLLVALLLGMVGRTGKIVWVLPYNANLTLRQMGLVLFLAGIGTQAGTAFSGTVTDIGLLVVIAGVLLTVLYSALTLFVGYKLLKVPMTVMWGLLAGIQTQSATLAFVNDRIDNDLPNISYATVYPTAMVFKTILVQVLLSVYGL